ncbi:TPA: DUF47 family protein, partial [Candidatus Micrarchaeota archaeon]|nr:DUF47 family protein [Candidatus Micrarchaeota archaeon]
VPFETEAQIKRKIVAAAQDHIRLVVKACRHFLSLAESLGDREAMKKEYEEIKATDVTLSKMKRSVTREVVSLGALVGNKDDVVRLVDGIGEMMDLIESASFRLLNFDLANVPDDVRGGLVEMAEGVLKAISSLKEAFTMFMYGPDRILSIAQSIEEKEMVVDAINRSLAVRLFSDNVDVKTTLALMQIIERLENAADLSLKVYDTLAILSV